MKTMILAATATLTLGLGSAYADSSGGQNLLTRSSHSSPE